jgi:HEAT repeat protein
MHKYKTIPTLLIVWTLIVWFNTHAALAQTGQSEALDLLIQKLKDKEWQTRWNAAAALGELKDPRAIDPLRIALEDENSYVRMTAARSLGEIDDSRVIAPLMEALQDESHGVRKNAILSLKKRTGQNLGNDPGTWLKWWEKNK